LCRNVGITGPNR